MQFRPLFKKNLLLWKRNKLGTFFEVFFPWALILVLYYLYSIRTDTEKVEQSYINQKIILPNNILTGPQIQAFWRFPIVKQCYNKNARPRISGRIGLAPQNEVTDYLNTFFTNLGFNTVFFNSKEEMDAEVTGPDYLNPLPNGEKRQLCFGVLINEYELNKFSYSLRFNLTGPNQADDHWDTSERTKRVPYLIESDYQYAKTLTSGLYLLQSLIETYILRNKASVNNIITLIRNKIPTYKSSDINSFLGLGLNIFMLFSTMIPFLRFNYSIVDEKQYKNLQNMRNMGLNFSPYLFSWVVYYYTLHFFVSLLWALLAKFLIFTELNYIYIFLNYLFLVYPYLSIAFLISAFFSNGKKSIIFSIIIYFLLYIFVIYYDNSPNIQSHGLGLALSFFSPLLGFRNSIIPILNNQSNYTSYPLSMFYTTLNDFNFGYFYLVMFFSTIFYLLLGFYFFNVIPIDEGQAKHPLFFLGFKRKKNVSF